jgi:hypothetical protein
MSVTPVINEEKVKSLLDTLLKNIQTEADPYLLNQYRALIRKNVSFFQRSYLAAYLLMLQDRPQGRQRRSGGDKFRGRPNFRNNSAVNAAEPGEGGDSARQGQRQAPASMALPEEESSRLFINIGRNRRVFPREILGLIGAKTSIAKEDIGLITIMNNYSFVQVRNSVAAELMDALNGVSFRGKTLTVNYARPRKEEDGAASDALDDDAYAVYDDAASGDEPIDDDPVDADAFGTSGDSGETADE